MPGYNLIALYRSHVDAEKARLRLIKDGIPDGHIRLVTAHEPAKRPGILGRLLPEREHDWYQNYLYGDRTAVCVRVHSEAIRERTTRILEQLDPMDEDEIVAAAPIGMPPTPPAREEVVAGAATAVQEPATAVYESGSAVEMVEGEATPGKPVGERGPRVRSYAVGKSPQK